VMMAGSRFLDSSGCNAHSLQTESDDEGR
jgi:hypothetical protein